MCSFDILEVPRRPLGAQLFEIVHLGFLNAHHATGPLAAGVRGLELVNLERRACDRCISEALCLRLPVICPASTPFIQVRLHKEAQHCPSIDAACPSPLTCVDAGNINIGDAQTEKR